MCRIAAPARLASGPSLLRVKPSGDDMTACARLCDTGLPAPRRPRRAPIVKKESALAAVVRQAGAKSPERGGVSSRDAVQMDGTSAAAHSGSCAVQIAQCASQDSLTALGQEAESADVSLAPESWTVPASLLAACVRWVPCAAIDRAAMPRRLTPSSHSPLPSVLLRRHAV